MGIFSFFKSGGALGGMVNVVGKTYLTLDKEQGSMLEKLVGVVAMRFLISTKNPIKAKEILEKFKLLAFHDAKIGLGDVCMFIAEAEMDVKGIESYVGEVILKNLKELKISDDVIYGEVFKFIDVSKEMEKLGLD